MTPQVPISYGYRALVLSTCTHCRRSSFQITGSLGNALRRPEVVCNTVQGGTQAEPQNRRDRQFCLWDRNGHSLNIMQSFSSSHEHAPMLNSWTHTASPLDEPHHSPDEQAHIRTWHGVGVHAPPLPVPLDLLHVPLPPIRINGDVMLYCHHSIVCHTKCPKAAHMMWSSPSSYLEQWKQHFRGHASFDRSARIELVSSLFSTILFWKCFFSPAMQSISQ